MTLSMVMVMDRNQLIGANGTMPWHLPSELQYFKSVTMGKPIIMGRKTHESIGRALPGRTNIVVTGNADYTSEGVEVVQSLEAAIELAQQHLDDSGEIMVIGGAQLCQLAMPKTTKLYLTEIDATFDGDTWLDSYRSDEWVESSCDHREADGYRLSYRVLERQQAAPQ